MSDTRASTTCKRKEEWSVGTQANGFVPYSSRANAVQSYKVLIKGDHTATLRKTEVLTITIITEMNDE